eukprot:TRINITY_DN48618_c0_g1_i4.p1 TRINITY_DN48618_c0_g1~~TRINITY_DN48618_c0_g1_i4.p1  ORF type:complete len:150 (+),score=11.00 TRINITY_DN48618_c0_g1_i4:68-517(+)
MFHCHLCFIVIYVSLPSMFHCHLCFIATYVSLSSMFHCHLCFIAIYVSLSSIFHCHLFVIVSFTVCKNGIKSGPNITWQSFQTTNEVLFGNSWTVDSDTCAVDCDPPKPNKTCNNEEHHVSHICSRLFNDTSPFSVSQRSRCLMSFVPL